MLSLFGLALAAAPPPIVGGTVTHEYAEVVLLYASDSSGSLAATCSGTVVAPGWVLTAAHCVADDGSFHVDQLYVMFVDRLSDASSKNSVLASGWVIHPDYQVSSGVHDVALVQFAGTGSAVAIYDTPPSSQDEGREYTIVGFGITSESDSASELTKHQASVPLDQFDGSFYYTFDSSQNACSGDSGGPLFRVSATSGAYSLVGVMNWVTACTGGTLASARIDEQLDFIEQYVEPTYADAYGDGPGLRPHDEAPDVDENETVDPNPVGCETVFGASWGAVAAACAGLARRVARRMRQPRA